MTKSLLICSIFLFVSCSSTTTIRTSDSDVTIFVDGQPKGKGAIVHTDSKIVGSSTSITLRKDGYPDENFVMLKNEQADVGAIIGGVFFLFPLLWLLKYDPDHYYEFQGTKKLLSSPAIKEVKEPKKIKDLKDQNEVKTDKDEEFIR